MMICSAINDLRDRINKIPNGQRTAIARQAGINESTLRSLLRCNLNTKTTDTLIRIERALDEIEREEDAA